MPVCSAALFLCLFMTRLFYLFCELFRVIISQTLDFPIRDVNFEIIIVEDGSPDGTQDIVKQLQQVYGENRVVSISHVVLPFV